MMNDVAIAWRSLMSMNACCFVNVCVDVILYTKLVACWFGHLTCKNRPRNDLLCVEWDVKPYTLT